jgi:hypothetical protein
MGRVCLDVEGRWSGPRSRHGRQYHQAGRRDIKRGSLAQIVTRPEVGVAQLRAAIDDLAQRTQELPSIPRARIIAAHAYGVETQRNIRTPDKRSSRPGPRLDGACRALRLATKRLAPVP